MSNVEPQFLYDLSDRAIEEQVNFHLATDADNELITAVSVTPGNVPDSDEFIELVEPQARDVTADKGYDTNASHQRLHANGQRSSIVVKKKRTHTDVIGQANPRSQRERANIERGFDGLTAGKFAEQEKYHGLRQARYWGLRRVTIQVLMTCLVVNCTLRHAQGGVSLSNPKRMARLMEANCGRPGAGLCPAEGMGRC